MKSLKMRFLITLIPVIAISLILVAGVIHKISNDRLDEAIIALNKSEAKTLSTELGSWLGNFITMIETASSSEEMVGTNDEKKKNYFSSLMNLDKELTDVYMGLETGKIINGSGWTAPDEYDPRLRPWYAAAVNFQDTMVGEPYLDMLTKEMVVAVAKKVVGKDGELRGVLAADINLKRITEMANSAKAGETGYAFIMTGNGTIIAHPKEELVGKNGFNDLGDSVRVLTETVTTKRDGHYIYTYDGQEKIATFSNIPNTNWKIVVTMPMAELLKDSKRMAGIVLMATLTSVIAATVLIIMMTRRITAPIVDLSEATLKLANGDLSYRTRMTRKDEIGVLAMNFNQMADSMGHLVETIIESTDRIELKSSDVMNSSQQSEEISSQIANAVHELAKGAEYQADRISDSTHRIIEVNHAVDQVSHHIDIVYGQAETIDGLTSLGQSTIQIQSEKMKENTDANSRVNETIRLLYDKTNEISQIISVIDDIAAQTNLLALNASIEAARAGEQGKGFSVVADEIRKLAEQSSQSTGRIATSITEIVDRTQAAVGEAEVASKALEAQTIAANKVFEIFDEVRSAVVDMNSGFTKVHECNDDIKRKIELVRTAMTNVSEVTQNNAASAEQVAASTEQQVTSLMEIRALAKNVMSSGSDLKKAVKGLKS